jgi:hypothetical protein
MLVRAWLSPHAAGRRSNRGVDVWVEAGYFLVICRRGLQVGPAKLRQPFASHFQAGGDAWRRWDQEGFSAGMFSVATNNISASAALSSCCGHLCPAGDGDFSTNVGSVSKIQSWRLYELNGSVSAISAFPKKRARLEFYRNEDRPVRDFLPNRAMNRRIAYNTDARNRYDKSTCPASLQRLFEP